MIHLPEILRYEAFDEDWESYVAAVYECFCELKTANLRLDGLPVKLNDYRLFKGCEETFWHVTGEGPDRDPAFRRCERVPWILPILGNTADPDVLIWRDPSRGEPRTIVWYQPENYVIVLRHRPGRDERLLTAYDLLPHRVGKLRKQYEEAMTVIDRKQKAGGGLADSDTPSAPGR